MGANMCGGERGVTAKCNVVIVHRVGYCNFFFCSKRGTGRVGIPTFKGIYILMGAGLRLWGVGGWLGGWVWV